MIFLFGFIFGAVTMALMLYCLYTGQWYRLSLYFFFDAAGLTTTSDDLVQFGDKKAVSKNRPKIRHMRFENDCPIVKPPQDGFVLSPSPARQPG